MPIKLTTYKNITYLLLLMHSVSFSYYENIIVYPDDGNFKGLSEDRMLTVKNVQKEFPNEVHRIILSKNDKRFISLIFYKHYIDTSDIKNNYRSSFIDAIKTMKIDDNDSISIKKAFDVYEKEGIKLFEKAGYSKRSGFSLKLDHDCFRRYGPMSDKMIIEDGILLFDEYFNGIFIRGSSCGITFSGGIIWAIRMEIYSNDDWRIIGKSPEISFHEALKKYLSSSTKKIIFERDATGNLCYFYSKNKTLNLCWKIVISAGSDSKDVYINALSGNTVIEFSNCSP